MIFHRVLWVIVYDVSQLDSPCDVETVSVWTSKQKANDEIERLTNLSGKGFRLASVDVNKRNNLEFETSNY